MRLIYPITIQLFVSIWRDLQQPIDGVPFGWGFKFLAVEVILLLGGLGQLALFSLCLIAVAEVGIIAWDVLYVLLTISNKAMMPFRKKKKERLERGSAAQAAAEASLQRARDQELELTRRNEHVRRVEARAQCELAYSFAAPEISARFPKSAMDAFMSTYMNDTFDAADVERRGKELQKIIEQHRNHAKPEKKPRTIHELAEWYLAEKERIESLPLDEEIKEEHLAVLNERYAELSQNVLQKIEP